MFMSKLYVDANELLENSITIAKKVYNNIDIKPDCVLSIWRGGGFPGKIIHEYLKFKNEDVKSLILRTSSYLDNNEQSKKMLFDISEMTIKELKKSKNILIVDDIFDTGKTMEYVLDYLKNLGIINIKIATIYYKPKNNKTNIIPNFYLYETDKWVVFPHELMGLTKKEISNKNINIEL